MVHKIKEKQIAIKLRLQGRSLNEISARLSVSKSSVSLWVRGVRLNNQQERILKNKSHKQQAIEKRRATRLRNEGIKRQQIIERAKKEIVNLSNKELWLIGVMLYWAEGGKTQRIVRFSNGDPDMIRIFMTFLRKICKVPEKKFRGYIHIHPHLDYRKAERYWSSVSAIPLNQFYKTYRKPNKSSKNKRNSLPFGVMDVYVCNVELFLTIKGWAEGIFQSY